MVYNFEKDSGYIVKYDDTETRMTNAEEVDIPWLNTYFEWNKIADGGDRLQLRTLAHPTPWLGKLNESNHCYHLYPVNPSMHAVFLGFVLEQMGWIKSNIISDETGEYTGRQMVLGDANTKLDIVFRKDAQEISFSKHLYLTTDPNDTFYPTLIERIADAFNAELSWGKHQEHFRKIVSETKTIRSR